MPLHLRRLAVAVALALIACTQGRTSTPVARAGTSSRGLHYSLSGRGEPLVLMHGFQTDHREWDEVAAELDDDHLIIRYDLRGHGRSANPNEPFFAHEDLLALLDELGVQHADLVGLSAGSNVALELALERPERVRKLIMISPGIPEIRVDASRDWMRPIIEAVRARDGARAASLWWESPMMEGTRKRGAAGERYRQVVLDNGRIWMQNPSAQQRPSPPPADRLHELRVPLLVIVGDGDLTGSQAQADSILARLPSAQRVIVSGAGHMISTERPGDLAAEITRFLRAERAAPPR